MYNFFAFRKLWAPKTVCGKIHNTPLLLLHRLFVSETNGPLLLTIARCHDVRPSICLCLGLVCIAIIRCILTRTSVYGWIVQCSAHPDTIACPTNPRRLFPVTPGREVGYGRANYVWYLKNGWRQKVKLLLSANRTSYMAVSRIARYLCRSWASLFLPLLWHIKQANEKCEEYLEVINNIEFSLSRFTSWCRECNKRWFLAHNNVTYSTTNQKNDANVRYTVECLHIASQNEPITHRCFTVTFANYQRLPSVLSAQWKMGVELDRKSTGAFFSLHISHSLHLKTHFSFINLKYSYLSSKWIFLTWCASFTMLRLSACLCVVQNVTAVSQSGVWYFGGEAGL